MVFNYIFKIDKEHSTKKRKILLFGYLPLEKKAIRSFKIFFAVFIVINKHDMIKKAKF